MVNRNDNNNNNNNNNNYYYYYYYYYEPKEIEIMGKKFKNVESFKYLGSLVSDLTETEIEIKSKLTAGNKSYLTLGPVLKKVYIPVN
jgi:hypothetical protein